MIAKKRKLQFVLLAGFWASCVDVQSRTCNSCRGACAAAGIQRRSC